MSDVAACGCHKAGLCANVQRRLGADEVSLLLRSLKKKEGEAELAALAVDLTIEFTIPRHAFQDLILASFS